MLNQFAPKNLTIIVSPPNNFLQKNENYIHLENKILFDYISFFTTPEGTDMLPYAYLCDENAYDNLLRHNPDYYLFNDEVELIKNNKEIISKYLDDITNIIEIGPGSHHTIDNKTLPMLSYAKNLQNYYALDHSANYLQNISNYIRVQTNNINVSTIKADFRDLENINCITPISKSCIMFLGSTLGNFNFTQQQQIINQIAKFSKKDDIFIISTDTNQDEKSLLAAYDNIYLYKLVNNILKYFTKIDFNFSKYIEKFEVEVEWNQKLQLVEIYFVAKESFDFNIFQYGKIDVRKGQKLKGVVTYKSNKNKIINLVEKNNFKVIDILNNTDKMQMFICKRI